MVDDPDDGKPLRAPPGAATYRGEPLATTQPGATATPTQDTVVPRRPSSAAPLSLPPAGYQIGELIGRGGMGEVLAAHDQRIGREVAIKRMRSDHPDGEQLARFLREARIQARLDHPAIVPVHELGTDEAGRPYFTMKRVSGRTLAQRMADGASLQALLRAFIDVCRAVDLAHSRAVIHRDLKPANIMMGDYGEVYVLDWGVARVLTDDTRHSVADIETLDDGTQTGALLGTPGFMAPEQIKGLPVTQPADVYALGAILFEILSGESLHPRGQSAIESTLTSPQEAPARRRLDRVIPPELDAACFAALAEDAVDRPTARQLADRVQAYLDGDRDLEQRRKIAAEQLALANDALAGDAPDARATAIRRAARALALDPESTEAAALLTQLIVEPPEALPPELVTQLEVEERKATRVRSRAGFWGLVSLFVFLAVIPFVHVRSWGLLVGFYAVVALVAVQLWVSSKTGRFHIVLALTGTFLLAVLWTRIAGIFLLTPVLACGVVLGLTTTQWLIRRRWLVFVWTAAIFLVPAALESAGVFVRSWEVQPLAIISHSEMLMIDAKLGGFLLFLANIMFVTIVGLIASQMHGTAKEAKRKVQIQKWHLNHLLPDNPRPWATRPR
jgi:serine/threonine-protein kinase